VSPLVSGKTRYTQSNNPQQMSDILSGVELEINEVKFTPRLKGSLAELNQEWQRVFYTTGSTHITVYNNIDQKLVKIIEITSPLTAKKFKGVNGLKAEIVAGFADKTILGNDFKISLEVKNLDGTTTSSRIQEFDSQLIKKKLYVLDADVFPSDVSY